MLTKKLWNHMIEVKEGFVPKKGKVYLVKNVRSGLNFSHFLFSFLFSFQFIFHFSIFRT